MTGCRLIPSATRPAAERPAERWACPRSRHCESSSPPCQPETRVSGFRPQAHLFLFYNTVPVLSAYSRILARFVQDYFCCICPTGDLLHNTQPRQGRLRIWYGNRHDGMCVGSMLFSCGTLPHPRASPRRPHVLFSARASPARGLCDTNSQFA